MFDFPWEIVFGVTSLAFRKCKKTVHTVIYLKLFWYKTFVHVKLKLLDFLSDIVLILCSAVTVKRQSRFQTRSWMNSDSHSHPQKPRSFWSATRIATSGLTSGRFQQRMSAINRLPVTLSMLRAKTDKYDCFRSHSIVFAKPIRTGISLDLSRGRDSWC